MGEKERFTGIKQKVVLPVAIAVIVTLVASVISIVYMRSIRTELDEIRNTTISEMEDIEQVRYQILHTAEILTDASATHEEEGFEEAAEFSAEVHTLIDGIIARDPEKAGTWNDIRTKYDEFYATCVKMARAYIDEGIDAGNAVMEVVDPLTDELSESVDAATEDVENTLEASVNDISKKTASMSVISIASSLLYIIFIAYIAVVVLKQMVRPVIEISGSLRRLADHDLTVDRIDSRRKDEIGGLIFAFNSLRDSLREIMGSLEASADELESLSGNMASQSETISGNVSDITRAVSNVAEMAGRQASDIEASMGQINDLQRVAEENAAASERLSEASGRISAASDKGNKVLDELFAVSRESLSSFEEIFSSIEKIMDSTARIGEASGMIDSIAGQTNLLSLNASIEAARAGDAGRGFSVVADEIRSLSDESASSVKEINLMIQELRANVENATRQSQIVRDAVERQNSCVEDTRSSYKAIADNLQSINGEIRNLGELSSSMRSSCRSVSSIMDNLAGVAEQNAANTEETTASIEEVLSMTEQINSGTVQVKQSTDSFSSVVRQYKL